MGTGAHTSQGGRAGSVPVRRAPAVPDAHLRRVDDLIATRSRPVAGRATRQARPAALVVAVALTIPLALAGCGDEGRGDDGPGVGGAAAPDRLELPLGTDPAAVALYVDDLLESYNASVNEIASAPTLAADPAGPALETYLALFEPDSAAAAQAVAFWRNQAAVGETTRPYEAGRPPFATRLDGLVETVSEDEVAFPTCVEVAFETVNAQGQRVDVEPGASVPGEGRAVRVGDAWLLRRLDQFEGTEGCGDEG